MPLTSNENTLSLERTMTVIPESQMVLMRKRKELHRLVKMHQLNEILMFEKQLFDDIGTAVEDKERSSKELLMELGSVISVYRELSILCCLYVKKLVL